MARRGDNTYVTGMTDPDPNLRGARRFDRQFDNIVRLVPLARGPIEILRYRWLFVLRVPLAILLILGGFLAILPVFGLWMIPVGLLLLAVDVPQLQGPVAALVIRVRRRVDLLRQRLRR